MPIKSFVVACAVAIGTCPPAAAQPPDDRPPTRPVIVTRTEEVPALSLRPFVMGSELAFASVNMFLAIFGGSRQRFFGGGLQVVVFNRYYAEVGASRFQQTGERVFYYNGETFRLGLPLTASITPFEITGGYRFRLSPDPVVLPYAGAGFGWYSYQETSPSSDPEEDVKVRHRGFVLTGGAEFRVTRWIHLALDAQYTRVPGILGLGGISQAEGEDDLGGLAGRLKFIIGR